jgi:hypothetical protein
MTQQVPEGAAVTGVADRGYDLIGGLAVACILRADDGPAVGGHVYATDRAAWPIDTEKLATHGQVPDTEKLTVTADEPAGALRSA